MDAIKLACRYVVLHWKVWDLLQRPLLCRLCAAW